MEITERTIQAEIVGFVGAFSLACIAVGQTNLAGYAIMALAGALSMAKVAEKQTETEPTQATGDTASDLSTEDLAKEVDANASLNDTSNSSVLPEAVNKVEDEVATATGLSDDQISQITDEVAAKVIASIQAQSQAATRTVVTQ